MFCYLPRLLLTVTIAISLANLFPLATGAQEAESEPGDDPCLELEAVMAWDSRYVSEGRDNTDGKSMYGTTLNITYGEVNLESWYGISPGARYDELTLSLTYTKEWEDFEAYVSAVHLQYFKDRGHDNEFVLGAAYSGLPASLTAGAEAYYSFEAWGTFAETYLSSEYELHERLTLYPAAILGWNLGYVPDGHQGINHLALSLEARTPLTDRLTLSLSATRYLALDRNAARYADDAMLKNRFVFGAALNATF